MSVITVKMFKVLFVVFLVSANAGVLPTEGIFVTIPGIGKIAGKIEDVVLPDGSQSAIAAFRGIPYAEPPVGQLRFAKPVPKANLTTPFQALQFGPSCPQRRNVDMSEDCLYLNVYLPSAALPISQNASAGHVPVYVWIHGGAFVSGDGRRDVGRLVVFGDIIIVTINYRLGALGFLATGDQEAPGNYGLWDQRLALQWVKANIRAFGGDPDRVTVGGGSAGAYCVTYQALYSPNRGLFQRFISASGTAISAGSTNNNTRVYATLLAGKFECDTESARAIVDCLRRQNYSDIVYATVDLQDPFELPWFPTVDGNFIQKNPCDQVTWPPSNSDLGIVRSTDSIFATEAADGSVSFGIWVEDMAQELNQSVQQGVSKQLFHTVVNKLLMSENQTPDPLVKDAIVYEYTDWEDPDNPATLGQSTVDLLTDQQWFVPNVVFSRNHALNNNHTSTYLLQFDLPKELTGQRYPWLRGAQHGQYNPFVWGLAGQTLNMSTAGDRKLWELSKAIMTYWSNFIKTGNPNNPKLVKEQWLPFNTHDEYYLYLDPDVTSARKRCKARRTDFWLDFLPKVKAASGHYQDNVNSDCSSSGEGQTQPYYVWTLLVVTVLGEMASLVNHS